MKPTFGLVPCTGVFGIEHTMDHSGPITRTVKDNALFLEVLAGSDGLDDRQAIPESVKMSYLDKIESGIKGLKIGILKEGFGHPNSEAVVDEQVRSASTSLTKLGAEVSEVSIPMHALGTIAKL